MLSYFHVRGPDYPLGDFAGWARGCVNEWFHVQTGQKKLQCRLPIAGVDFLSLRIQTCFVASLFEWNPAKLETI